jgi:hypothetical protein
MVEQQVGPPRSTVLQACDQKSSEGNSVGIDSDSGDLNSDFLDDTTQSQKDSNGGHRTTVNDDEMKQIENLARHETSFLRVWRLVVLLLILGTCAVATAGAYMFIRNDQNRAIRGSVSV